MDSATGLTILGAAVGSAKLVEKLLGPTAEYIGDGLKVWTEKRIDNVGRIMNIAAKKLGESMNEAGSVPPKVLRGILDEGSFCEDQLAAEYFGGVLASSRSDVARDDRGSAYIALLGRLSAYQIRAHYCFYHIFQTLFFDLGETVDLTTEEMRPRLETMIPLYVYSTFMDFQDNEDPIHLLPHIMSGLAKEMLIRESYGDGTGTVLEESEGSPKVHRVRLRDYMNEILDPEPFGHGFGIATYEVLESPEAAELKAKKRRLIRRDKLLSRLCIAVQPTIPGIELFLWAHGRPELSYSELFHPANKFDLAADITISHKYYRRGTY